MAGSDIRTLRASSISGNQSIGRCRLRQMYVTCSGGAGRLTLRNSGVTLLDLDFTTGSTYDVYIPDEGILFTTDIHIHAATTANITGVTFMYS